MEIDSIPDIFQIKIRLSILSALISGDKKFRDIKEMLDTSDGNLGAQLLKLESAEYISCKKEFLNRIPQSTYSLTATGRRMFEEYVEMLERILNKK